MRTPRCLAIATLQSALVLLAVSLPSATRAGGDVQDPQTDVQAVRIFTAVPSGPSATFRGNAFFGLRIRQQPNVVVNHVTPAFTTTVSVGPGVRVFLSGSEDGRAGWSVDNFVLLEITAGSSPWPDRYYIGQAEGDVEHGIASVPRFGRPGINQLALEITSLLGSGPSATLTISALDYGTVGFVSDLFLVTVRPAPLPPPGATPPDLSGLWSTTEVPGVAHAHPGTIRITQQGWTVTGTWEAPPPYVPFKSDERITAGAQAFKGRIQGSRIVGTSTIYAYEHSCNQGWEFAGDISLDINAKATELRGRARTPMTYWVQGTPLSATGTSTPTGKCGSERTRDGKGLESSFALVRKGAPPAPGVELRFVRQNGDRFEPITGALRTVEPFFVEARFAQPPAESQQTVTVTWENGGTATVVLTPSSTDPRLFRSEVLKVNPIR